MHAQIANFWPIPDPNHNPKPNLNSDLNPNLIASNTLHPYQGKLTKKLKHKELNKSSKKTTLSARVPESQKLKMVG